MTILALDTSMAACSAAILPPGTAAPIQRFARMERGHAEALFPMIEAVMAEAGCDFGALTRIAVTVGPGGFTGIRAGVAAARGLALAAGVPTVSAGSLEVMAAGCVRQFGAGMAAGGFVVAHDAKRGELYVQAFAPDATPIAPPGVFLLIEALAAIPPGVAVAFGSGAEALAIEAQGQGRHLRHALADLVPEAADLARLAATRSADDIPPVPLYLRAPDAKPQTGKSLGRAQH